MGIASSFSLGFWLPILGDGVNLITQIATMSIVSNDYFDSQDICEARYLYNSGFCTDLNACSSDPLCSTYDSLYGTYSYDYDYYSCANSDYNCYSDCICTVTESYQAL